MLRSALFMSERNIAGQPAYNNVRDNDRFRFKGSLQKSSLAVGARQLHALRGYLRPRAKKLRVSDIKVLFEQVRDWRKQRGRRST
jgi:hypothetical protein